MWGRLFIVVLLLWQNYLVTFLWGLLVNVTSGYFSTKRKVIKYPNPPVNYSITLDFVKVMKISFYVNLSPPSLHNRFSMIQPLEPEILRLLPLRQGTRRYNYFVTLCGGHYHYHVVGFIINQDDQTNVFSLMIYFMTYYTSRLKIWSVWK